VTALLSAASRLIRTAYSALTGISPATWAMRMNIGLPGWCGIPSDFAAAMYSPASHIAADGDSVST
jgi:hypothetical protein